MVVVGAVLVWFPILVTIVTSIIGTIASGEFRCDYFIPMELFLVVLVGGILLVWGALRTRKWRKLICWSFGSILGVLVLTLLLANVTGLASGTTKPEGWPLAIVFAGIILYIAALIVLGVGAGLLLREVFKKTDEKPTA